MRIKKGIVTSNKQEKTLVVTVHTYKNHPKYKKRYRVSRKYHVHNPENKKFEIGDEITIGETKPISKFKRWCVYVRSAQSTQKPKTEQPQETVESQSTNPQQPIES